MRISAVVLLGAAISIAAALGGSQQPEAKPTTEKPGKPEKPTARVDRFGDPLPEGALMRLGTARMRVPQMAGVGFRPNGELVAIDERLKIHVWPPDGNSPPRVASVDVNYRGYGPVTISPDACSVAAIVENKKVTVWDISTKHFVELMSRAVNDVYKICFSANGDWLVINDRPPQQRGIISLCNLKTKTWADLPFDGDYAESFSFSADGKWLVVTSHQGVEIIETVRRKGVFRANMPRIAISFAAISPDGKTLAIQSTGWIHGPMPKVRFVSVQTGDEVTGLKSPPGKAESWISFSPDGKTVFQGGPEGIREWDPVAGKIVQEIGGPGQSPVVFSRDGRRLASRSDAAVLLCDNTNRRPVRADLENAGHTNGVSGIVVSPDGKLIATTAYFGEIRVWSAGTGRFMYALRSTLSGEEAVAFLPDSKSFVALADDYVTPAVFDAAAGRELRRFKVPAEMAKKVITRGLRLSSDGKTLITTADFVMIGDEKSYAAYWDVGTGKSCAGASCWTSRVCVKKKGLLIRRMGNGSPRKAK